MSVLSPYETAKFVSTNSSDVKIDEENIKKLSELIFSYYMKDEYSVKSWKQHAAHPKLMDQTSVDWIFFVDTLNFSFWSENQNNKLKVSWKGGAYTGYFSLCAAANKAIDAGIPITDPKYYRDINLDKFTELLQSDDGRCMPLMDERLRLIHEAGNVIVEKFNGSFVNCIKQSNKSALKLLTIIVENFSSFKDEAEYIGKRVSFYKRAQILISDIWACFEGQGLGEFHDIEMITMFADYRIPQVLAYFGVLKYSEHLNELLDKDYLFKNGDKLEVELRACSIWCVELIRKEIDMKCSDVCDKPSIPLNSILIDNFLWDYRRAHDDDVKVVPFHKVRCIYY